MREKNLHPMLGGTQLKLETFDNEPAQFSPGVCSQSLPMYKTSCNETFYQTIFYIVLIYEVRNSSAFSGVLSLCKYYILYYIVSSIH